MFFVAMDTRYLEKVQASMLLLSKRISKLLVNKDFY